MSLFEGFASYPKDWQQIEVGELISDLRGGSPLEPDDFIDKGFPVFHKGAIKPFGEIEIDLNKKTFTHEAFVKKHTSSVVNQSYLVVTLRDLVPSGPTIGLIADLSAYPFPKCILAQGVYAFRVNRETINPKYLVYLSNTAAYRTHIRSLAVGSTQIHVRTPVFTSLFIPLPSLKEQEQITAILEKADRLRRQRRYALQLSESFLRSVFLKMFGDPVTNPMGWKIEEMGSHISSIRYGTGSPPVYQEKGIPFIRATNIKKGTVQAEGLAYISKSDAGKIAKCKVKEGDLIIVRSGVNTGDCGLIPSKYSGAYAAYDLIVEVPFPGNYFYNFIINSEYGKSVIGPLTRRAGQPHLNAEQVQALRLPSPPISLQKEFAAMAKRVERLHTQQREAERQAEHLFQTLLHRAFRGELTARKPAVVVASSCRDSVSDRGAILSYIVHSQSHQRTFGHVKCAKLLYWTATYVGVDMGGKFRRAAAGPLADFLKPVEEAAKEKGWFTLQPRSREGYSYQPGPNIAERVQAAIEILGERKEKLDKLLEDMAGVPSDQVEAGATLFAVWNDFLIDGHKPTDNEIIQEALENWHPDKKLKKLFNPVLLRAYLQWLKDINLTPTGNGTKTIGWPQQ
jgi:type I restriction enzyme S subunit